MDMTETQNWKMDEVNYRLAKMVLQTLMRDGLLDESEVAQILQHLRTNSSAFVARIEEDSSCQEQLKS